MMKEIRVRAATAADYDFLWWLHQVTMKEFVDKTWGWDHEFQATRFRDAFATDQTELQIIQCGAERVGYIRVVDEPTRLFLAALEIAPSYQRRGIGKSLIEDVCKRGDSIGLPVELQVLKVNPAKTLYERLGFSVQAETETHYVMRRARVAQPDQVSDRASSPGSFGLVRKALLGVFARCVRCVRGLTRPSN